jgi:TolB-like protein/Tfp pilus assembly protein PilF
LFGGFKLLAAEQDEIPVCLSKDRALFTYLALQAGKRFARGHLAGLLWGEQPEPKARHSLSQSLSAISEALGPRADILHRGRKEVGITEGSVQADVDEFQKLSDDADPPSRLRALELYQDPLLADFDFEEPAFDDWAYGLRAETQDRAMRAGLSYLAEQGGGNTAERLQVARRLIRLDPCCEAAHQALIRLHVEAGEPGAAVRQYETCRTLLQDELGIDPTPETKRALELAKTHIASSFGPPEAEHDTVDERKMPSLAVLPFANLSGNPNLNYLALGLADDITTELTRFRDLFVISRDSAFGGDVSSDDSPTVCRRLGVRHCVRGSLRRIGRGLRINLHLVEGESGQNVWSERYDLGEEELPNLTGEVLAQIVGRLAAWLEREALNRARHKPTENWNAYDHLLQGLEHHNRSWYGVYNTMRAIKHFECAIELDPGCARAHAYLACAKSIPYFKDRKRERLAPCTEIAHRALELDPTESEAHRILGGVHLTQGEHQLSELHFEEAQRIHPGQATILAHAARYHMHAGDPGKAKALLGQARQLNPMHPPWYWEHVGIAHFVNRDYEAAIDDLSRMQNHSFYDQLYAAAANAYLGRKKHAAHNLAFVREKKPRLTIADAPYYLPYRAQEDLHHVVDGLKLAGLTA